MWVVYIMLILGTFADHNVLHFESETECARWISTEWEPQRGELLANLKEGELIRADVVRTKCIKLSKEEFETLEQMSTQE